MSEVVLKSTITCPKCGHQKEETIDKKIDQIKDDLKRSDRLMKIIAGTFSAIVKPTQIVQQYHQNESFKTAIFILITLFPTGLVYVFAKDFFEAKFNDPRFVCGMLFVTGTLLLLTLLRKNPIGKMTPLKALVTGIAQSAAMIPGIAIDSAANLGDNSS